jgi:hypothetical protein
MSNVIVNLPRKNLKSTRLTGRDPVDLAKMTVIAITITRLDSGYDGQP